jgi:hypothetical protein
MFTSRVGLTRRLRRGRRLVVWAGLSVGWLLPSVGCQVDYAGMTLPSGKYMYDDVQYFPPGPDFPWANTQAATQRARMRAMGIDVGPDVPSVGPVGPPPPAAGALAPVQEIPNRPTNVNVMEPEVIPPPGGGVPGAGAPAGAAPPAGGAVPPPAGAVPPPGGTPPEAGGDMLPPAS